MKRFVCKLLLSAMAVVPMVTPFIAPPKVAGQERVIRLCRVYHRPSPAFQWECIIVEGESAAQTKVARYINAGQQSFYQVIR